MTKLQEQIVEKKAAIESKKMYGVPSLTLKRLEDELKELRDKEIQRLRDSDKRTAEGVEARYIAKSANVIAGVDFTEDLRRVDELVEKYGGSKKKEKKSKFKQTGESMGFDMRGL